MVATILFRLLSSHLLSINVKIGINNNIILSVVVHEFETSFLTLTDEYRLRVGVEVLRR
jgi:hypothetical protein